MATEVFRIPLTNIPQRFAITLSGIALTFVTAWNGEAPAWMLDIYDGITDAPLVLSLPLVAGADLLEQFQYVGIPGALIVFTDGEEFEPPTFDNLGQEANLFYSVDP